MSIWLGNPTDPAGSRRRGRALLAVSGLFVLIAAGCASSPDKPPALAPQTVSSVADPERAISTSPEPPAQPPAPPASTIPKTIVIDDGGESDDGQSLVAAAEAERERRSQSHGATVVINDENLKSKAVGLLTVASPAPREDPAESTATEPPGADSPAAESYWREQMLAARREWRDLVDEIDDLEGEVNLLRRRFYDEDDPYYRDSQIKPAWDRALDRLRVARLLAEEAEDIVYTTLEDGRLAGAQPGWLREGVELEPTPGRSSTEARPRRLREYEPGEPQIYDPDEDDGDGAPRHERQESGR